MPIRVNLVSLAAAGLLLAALPASAKTAPKKAAGHKAAAHKAAPLKMVEDAVLIENTGSTNTKGYSITVGSSGNASYRVVSGREDAPVSLPRPRMQVLPKEVTTRLFADLVAAGPMASLPVRHAMRSVSFGTETYVTYKGQRSPDLSFPSSPLGQAVRDDVMTITRALRASNEMRFPLNRPALP